MEDATIGVPRNFAGTTLPEVGELEEDPESLCLDSEFTRIVSFRTSLGRVPLFAKS